MSARDEALKARQRLMGNGKLDYFRDRGIRDDVVKEAFIGYVEGHFAYPCIGREGGLYGVHYKSEERDERGKRHHRWGSYSTELPAKANGAPAKIVPWGMETLDSKPGSLVVLCCGEEDALSLRQIGYTALSQPGAGLLEPVYAQELAEREVVVFYDAGEEEQALKDARKLQQAGASEVKLVRWPLEASHGADINSRLADDEEGFERWVAEMISAAEPLTEYFPNTFNRGGEPDRYASDIVTIQEPAWPALAHEALEGLPGDVVRAIEPHTEADRVALLTNLLAAFGNALGRGTFFKVGADVHHLNINAVLVGESSKGRKGMSWRFVEQLMRTVDGFWSEHRVQNGLSSGEGLIYAVRDRVTSENKDGEHTVVDAGAEDKRLFVMEGEFASVLKTMTREGNVLSPVIRQAWDGGKLTTLTRNSPLKATDAHISIVGHITKAELLKHLSETETANGFANRFLFAMVRRSQELPFGGEWDVADTAALVQKLDKALQLGKKAGRITWGKDTRELWASVYGSLSEGKPGLFGTITSRAEAQVVRLACLYAVMALSRTIELPHLRAALALWKFTEHSALYIFGDATGDAVADRIMSSLRAAPSGLSRNEIRDLFGRHQRSDKISRALASLEKTGRTRRELTKTKGRPAERWHAK